MATELGDVVTLQTVLRVVGGLCFDIAEGFGSPSVREMYYNRTILNRDNNDSDEDLLATD